jgi:hypothetical protein
LCEKPGNPGKSGKIVRKKNHRKGKTFRGERNPELSLLEYGKRTKTIERRNSQNFSIARPNKKKSVWRIKIWRKLISCF